MSNVSDFLANDELGEPTSLIVSRLVDILGSRLCAVIGDVKQTSTVREWIDGKEPTVGRERILRLALRVANAIAGRYGSDVAQSWFQGANHVLADESLALVLKRASCGGVVDALEAERKVNLALREYLDL
jgi:hypothetical protein